MKKLKKIFRSPAFLLLSIVLTFGLSVSLQSVIAAWTAPTDVPPGNNVQGPIYTYSPDKQSITSGVGIEVGPNLAVTGPMAATRAAFLGWISGDGDNEGIFINSAGYVGIGTSTPQQMLDLGEENVRADRFYDTDTNYFADLKTGGTLGGTWNMNGSLNVTGNITAAPAIANNHLTTKADVLGLISSNAGTINSGTVDQVAYYSATGRVLSSTPVLSIVGSSVRISNAYNLPNYDGGTGVFLRGDGNWAAVSAMPAGTAAGQTLNYNGTSWVVGSNIFNNGGNVGVGTNVPAYKLDVNGTVSVNSLNVNDAYTLPTTVGTNGQVLTANSSGGSSWVTPSSLPIGTAAGQTLNYNGTSWVAGTNIYNNGGNVGIGIAGPSNKLTVLSGAIGDGIYVRSGGVGKQATFGLQNSSASTYGLVALASAASDFASDALANDMIIRSNGTKLLLSTSASGGASSLSINGSTVRVSNAYNLPTTTGINGQVLTTNGAGISSWVTPSAGASLPSGSLDQTLRHNGTTWAANSAITTNGTNVGIGMSPPSAYRLQVNGTAVASDVYIANTGKWASTFLSSTPSLSCVTVEAVLTANGAYCQGTASCASGYTLTGGGCNSALAPDVQYTSRIIDPNAYSCVTGGASAGRCGNYRAQARCCRMQ